MSARSRTSRPVSRTSNSPSIRRPSGTPANSYPTSNPRRRPSSAPECTIRTSTRRSRCTQPPAAASPERRTFPSSICTPTAFRTTTQAGSPEDKHPPSTRRRIPRRCDTGCRPSRWTDNIQAHPQAPRTCLADNPPIAPGGICPSSSRLPRTHLQKTDPREGRHRSRRTRPACICLRRARCPGGNRLEQPRRGVPREFGFGARQ